MLLCVLYLLSSDPIPEVPFTSGLSSSAHYSYCISNSEVLDNRAKLGPVLRKPLQEESQQAIAVAELIKYFEILHQAGDTSAVPWTTLLYVLVQTHVLIHTYMSTCNVQVRVVDKHTSGFGLK